MLQFAIASLGRRRGPPFLGRLAAKELTGGEVPEAFNFFVNRSQQVLQDGFQFPVRGFGDLGAELSDSIVEAALVHGKK